MDEYQPPDLPPAGVPTGDTEEASGLDGLGALPTRAMGDGLTQEQMRGNLRAKLFGVAADPVRLGRFVIIERLGQGGMGTVYSAFDPDLERRVALKVLRHRERASLEAEDRLLREAQALARLSHPNVVPVYEVGLIDDQIFIVMEFVRGRNLRQWVEAEDPSWRAILEVYQQAGRGLAAAHAARMVHRDFKPDNVQIGEDGRVRVLDFGIVRTDADSSEDSSGSARPPTDPQVDALEDTGSLPTRLTATGSIIGTPGFMAPEQFRGGLVGPHSDQFSFCASLYRSLYQQPPFAGDTVVALFDRVERGDIEPPPRTTAVPGWLFAVLRRGLSPDPADRYPSMDALLRDLGRDPARTRRRVALGALALALLGAAVYASTRAPAAGVVPCQFGADEFAGSWDDDQRQDLARLFAGIDAAYAASAWSRVEPALDQYASAWLTMRRSACMAHQRGEQSGDLLDRRIACLDQRRDALASAVAVLGETDRQSLAHTVDVVHNLPALDECGDTQALMVAAAAAAVAPPRDAATATQVDALRSRLARARALHHGGSYDAALALTQTLTTEAHAVGYRPLTAEVALLQGHINISRSHFGQAIAPLRQAMADGFASGVDRLALEALARLLFVESRVARDASGVLSWLAFAEPMHERVASTAFEHALLLNNAGAASMRTGQRAAAEAFFRRALEVAPADYQGRNIELVNIWLNRAAVTDDADARAHYAERATAVFAAELGENHPSTLNTRVNTSAFLRDPEAVRASLARTYELYRRYHPTLIKARAECAYYLGFLEAELGQAARAAAYFADAAALYSQREPEEMLAHLARGYQHYYSGHHDDAAREFNAALDEMRAHLAGNRWLQKFIGHALLGLGLSRSAADPAAREALGEAVELLKAACASNHKMDCQRRLAQAEYALAAALRQTPPGAASARADEERADQLERQAQATYLATAPGKEATLRALAPWIRASASPP